MKLFKRLFKKPKPASKPKSTSDHETKPRKYHVSFNNDAKSEHYKMWRVRKEHSDKTIKYFKTQKEAIAYAESLAEHAHTSVVVHKLDGTIRKQHYR